MSNLVKVCVQVPIRAMKRKKDGRYFKNPVQSILDVIDKYSNKGVGGVGNYDNVAFIFNGKSRYRAIPGSDASPSAGEIGELHEEPEKLIMFNSPQALLEDLIKDIRENHPYEEPVIDVYKIENLLL